CPPIMRRPTTRLAYCTGMRRCAPSTKTMNATTATINTRSPRIAIGVNAPHACVLAFSYRSKMARGKPTTMPTKMISDIPLPMPRSLICSPSHMMNAEPVVSVRIVISVKPTPGWYTNDWPPSACDCSVLAIVEDWMMLSKIVKYRVYWVIFRRPSSPSFCNRSRYGNTTVINCRMMDEVMYGMMPRAKIVSRRKLPPLNRSKIPSTDPADCLKRSSSTVVLMPGVGMCAPRRYTASSPSVKNSRFRRSSMRKRFANAFKKRFIPVPRETRLRLSRTSQDYHLKHAAGLGDLFLRRGAECVGVNGELGLQLAIAQNLDGIRGAAHKTVRAQQLRRHRLAFGEHVEFLEVDDGILHAERIVEPALRNAPVQRHLPAFKAAPPRIAAPRFLALVALPGSPAELRADAAAHAHFTLARALGRPEGRK